MNEGITKTELEELIKNCRGSLSNLMENIEILANPNTRPVDIRVKEIESNRIIQGIPKILRPGAVKLYENKTGRKYNPYGKDPKEPEDLPSQVHTEGEYFSRRLQ